MKVIKVSAVVAAILWTNSAFAITRGEINPALSYEIGGYSKHAVRKNRSVPLGATLSWGKDGFCGAFDQSLSVTNVLNNVSGKAKQLESDLVSSATGLISNAPWVELARLDPTLYEVVQQGKLDALEEFNFSVASCEEAAGNLASGDFGNIDAWIKASTSNDWSEKAAEGGDAVQAKSRIEENKGNSGIKWIAGQQRGGVNQKPIEVEKDIILAGYNLLAGRQANATSSAKSDSSPSYTKIWETPAQAQDWITDIIGETTISTCSGCNKKQTKPGRGVYGYLEQSQAKFADSLSQLVKSKQSNLTAKDLDLVSAPGIPITQQIIEALRQESLYQQSLTEKLAEELATNDVIERLIAARQILIAGKREAYISESKQAIDIIDDRIKLLNEEMGLIDQDLRLRQAVRNSVGVTILARQSARKGKSTLITSDAMERTSDTVKQITGTNQ